MDFSTSPEQDAIRAAVRQLCRDFDGAYWRETDANRRYPDEFVRALTALPGKDEAGSDPD